MEVMIISAIDLLFQFTETLNVPLDWMAPAYVSNLLLALIVVVVSYQNVVNISIQYPNKFQLKK